MRSYREMCAVICGLLPLPLVFAGATILFDSTHKPVEYRGKTYFVSRFEPRNFIVSYRPTTVGLRDTNNDGRADIAVEQQCSGRLTASRVRTPTVDEQEVFQSVLSISD